MEASSPASHPGYRWVLGSALGLFGFVALLLVLRRVRGGLHQPLDTRSLLATGFIFASASVALPRLWRRVGLGPTRTDTAVCWFTSVALLAVAVSLSLSGTGWPALAAFWTIVAGAELGIHYGSVPFRNGRSSPREANDRQASSGVSVERPDSRSDPNAASRANLLQEISRTRMPDGRHVFAARLRAELAPGARSASVHVAFCPPFAAIPEVDLAQAEGPEARLKMGQVLPYGARIEVRLPHATDEPSEVVVEFTAWGE